MALDRSIFPMTTATFTGTFFLDNILLLTIFTTLRPLEPGVSGPGEVQGEKGYCICPACLFSIYTLQAYIELHYFSSNHRLGTKVVGIAMGIQLC